MKKGESTINLFEYLDYRAFLKDLYRSAKNSRASFSFRRFSQTAGFASPNFLKLVMDGKRNLTEDSLPKFMTGLRLNKQEQEFFRNLVFYNQAKTNEKKDYYYQRLIQSKKFSQLKPIEKHQYEYCSEWYHSVIRELVVSKEFDGTPEWLAGRIFPSITPPQARRSLETLEKLGFIKKNDEGKYQQSSPLVSTGSEVTSLALYNYHMNLLDVAKKALEQVPAEQRDMSSMTLGVAKSRVAQIKKMIQEFRQQVMKAVSTDTSPEEVVQLSIQMFPLTRGEEESLC